MKVKTTPANRTEELSSADLRFEDTRSPAGGLEDLNGAPPPNHHPTPSFIAAMGMEREGDVSDEISIPTMLDDLYDFLRRKRNILITLGISILIVVALIALVRSGGTPPETDSGTMQAMALVDDGEAEEDGSLVEFAVDDAALIAMDANEAAPAYDVEKCAAPTTDREWLECASAAYSDLRQEQKRLTARIAELEGRPASSGMSKWHFLLASLPLYGLIALLFGLIFFILPRTRKGSGKPAS